MSALTSNQQDLLNDLLKDPTKFRNMAIIAHVDHGKTTLTDSLIAEAGLLNKDLAGSALMLDSSLEEQERGITINTGNISLPYKNQYLINLKDTPGHADFGNEVTKAIRSVDGCLLLVDAMEGVMTQTEGVLGSAVKENLPIILFINKVDRMIKELNYAPNEIYNRLIKVITSINDLISNLTGFSGDYFALDRSVILGSALDKWALTANQLKASNVKFSSLVELIRNRDPSLSQNYNLARTVLDEVCEKFQAPKFSQKDKLRSLFQDSENTLPKDLLDCDPLGTFRGVVNDINHLKLIGTLTTIRVMSGTLKKGDTLYTSSDDFASPRRVTKIYLDMAKGRMEIDTLPAGGVGLIQTNGLTIGDTIIKDNTDQNKIIFPNIVHSRESVVTVALRPKNSSEVTKLMSGLKSICDHDPTLKLNYDLEAGEFQISGIGELQIEVSLHKLKDEYGIQVQVGAPTVNYTETIADVTPISSSVVRTPNGHNDFQIEISRLPDQLSAKLIRGEVDNKKLSLALQTAGYDRKFAKKAVSILNGGSVYVNNAKGAIYMDEVKENIVLALNGLMAEGPKLRKPLRGLLVTFTFAKIHEDSLRRSALQFRSAFKDAFEEIFKKGRAIVVEPVMQLGVNIPESPSKYTSLTMRELENRRGVMLDSLEGNLVGYLKLIYKIPLKETFGLNTVLMSHCEGRVQMSLSLKGYESVPDELVSKLVAK